MKFYKINCSGLEKWGISMVTLKWSKNDEIKIKNMVDGGESAKAIAAKFNVSGSAVAAKLKTMGLRTQQQLKNDAAQLAKLNAEPYKPKREKRVDTYDDITKRYRNRYKIGQRIKIGGKRCEIVGMYEYYMIVKSNYRFAISYTDLYLRDAELKTNNAS